MALLQLSSLRSQQMITNTCFPVNLRGSKPSSRVIISMAALTSRPREAPGTHDLKKITHSMPPEKLEIFRSMEGWVEENILTFLKPVESSWQPHDFLPDPSLGIDAFMEGVSGIMERSAEIPDEFLVCLAGNMITEEALPTYQSVFNTFDGVRDETGSSLTPWARWARRWSAEENRHGDLLNKYLYLTGRLNMRKVEMTIQYLIGSGMIIGSENNPYMGFVYTSFQERATFISHGNTARHAKEHGDITLARICGTIAADEKRHENAYTKITEKLFEIDPDTTMQALARMMRHRIVMPAFLVFDGDDHHLFDHYSAVAQRVGVYTARDYIDNLDFFIKRWEVEKISSGLSAEGRRAQEYVCGLARRMRKMEERAHDHKAAKQANLAPFSWIFNRSLQV